MMARLVKQNGQGPQQVGDKWVCMCGLSKNKPFCDSSHKRTKDEKEGVTYVYDEEKRVEVK